MEKYTLNLDINNYVLSIAHTKNDSVELDLSKYDINHISCYQFINGTFVLDETKLANVIKEEEGRKRLFELSSEKQELEQWLRKHDYIGVKVATGRATISDYQEEIALMNIKANRINEIDKLLNEHT